MLAAIPRTRARDVFVRGFGVVFVAAFVSLLAQVRVLYGARGLLPACRLVDATDWTQTPSLFHLSCGDVALQTGAAAGALLGVVLALGFVPRVCLVACWLLYFSFVSVGQDFLWFQWDNLLLETGFFALFVTPGGRRLRGAPAPPAAGVFLMLWLLIRLQFESGAAKLLLGDPTWRDLTAMATYYETAPLPTWVGWWAHQMPTWAHRASALFTYVVELGLPWLVFGPRPLRLVAFVGMAAMQVSVIATANYGFFNYLSLALCLWVLDDGHLAWLARRLGRAPPARRAGTAPGSAPCSWR